MLSIASFKEFVMYFIFPVNILLYSSTISNVPSYSSGFELNIVTLYPLDAHLQATCVPILPPPITKIFVIESITCNIFIHLYN